MTAKETAGRDGKGEDGRARTREVKLAVFFTQDKLDEDGYPVRDRASTSVIATFEPAAAFGGLVQGRGHPPRRGPRPAVHHPRRRRRLDLGHRHRQVPRGHPGRGPVPRPRAPARPRPQPGVHAAATARTNGSPPASKTSTTATSTASWPPSASTPSKASRKTRSTRPSATSRTTPPACATTGSAHCGLFVGSGVVEASCKTDHRAETQAVRHALDRRGADAIIALRCREASSTWEAICNTPHTQTRTA